MESGCTLTALPPARPSTWSRMPVTMPDTGEDPPAAPIWVSRPPRTEQPPDRSLPPATLVGLRSRLAGKMPFTVLSRLCTPGERGLELDPGAVVAAGTLPQIDEAAGSEPPRSCCSTLVRLTLMDTLARLPVPVAVGLPLASSAAEAVPQETLTLTRPVSMGSVQPLAPVGVAVTSSPLATASCVMSRSPRRVRRWRSSGTGWWPPSRRDAGPVPEASAKGVLLASASDPPPESCTVLSRLSETKPPLPWTFHWVPGCAPPLDDSAPKTDMATHARTRRSGCDPSFVTPYLPSAPSPAWRTPLPWRYETGD